MTRGIWRPLFIFIVFAGYLLFGLKPAWGINEQLILSGVSLNGIELGGKNKPEVAEICQEENRKMAEHKIYLHLPGDNSVQEVTFGAMGIEVDAEIIWQKAYSLGRESFWLERFKQRWRLWRKGIELPLSICIKEEKAAAVLTEVGQELYLAPEDATFYISDQDEVQIIPEKAGRRIAVGAALAELQKKYFPNGMMTEAAKDLHLYLITEQIMPAKTQLELAQYGVQGLVSKCTTYFNTGKVGRTNNIRLAGGKLDYVLIPPAQVFSFNEVVGPRTKEEGYDEADIIYNYSFVPAVGGGVCQVSSTLYNAVLLADLEIVERAPHSMVISYVKPGLDATVVYGSRDFRFKNNTDHYILLKTTVTNGTLTCKVFGQQKRGKKVILKTFKEREIPYSTIYQEDRSVPPGRYVVERKGIAGSVIRVERQVLDEQGQLIKEEVVSRDYYPPVDSIIRKAVDRPQSLSISAVL